MTVYCISICMTFLKFLLDLFIFVYDILPACMYVNYMHTWCSEGYKKMSDPLKLKLQIVVSHNGGS